MCLARFIPQSGSGRDVLMPGTLGLSQPKISRVFRMTESSRRKFWRIVWSANLWSLTREVRSTTRSMSWKLKDELVILRDWKMGSSDFLRSRSRTPGDDVEVSSGTLNGVSSDPISSNPRGLPIH